jgi:hypothetical protein
VDGLEIRYRTLKGDGIKDWKHRLTKVLHVSSNDRVGSFGQRSFVNNAVFEIRELAFKRMMENVKLYGCKPEILKKYGDRLTSLGARGEFG